MVIYILTVYYQALCENWQRQDSTKTESSRNIIGHIFYNQIFYWSINEKTRLSKNVLCDFGVCPDLRIQGTQT
jgi:hypothetical protein